MMVPPRRPPPSPRTLPAPMAPIGLALSGGGFRATLHHLGVIRYLRDAGCLAAVSDIAAVSGGSILAAHLVLNWDRYTGTDADFDQAAAEVIRFVQFDVRNRIVRRLPLLFPFRATARLFGLPARWLAPTALLERYYREFLYGDRRLFELPVRPGLHILATNVSDGVLAVFNRDGLHIQNRDFDTTDSFRHVPGWTGAIARVVAASSAFPGFFAPVEITAAWPTPSPRVSTRGRCGCRSRAARPCAGTTGGRRGPRAAARRRRGRRRPIPCRAWPPTCAGRAAGAPGRRCSPPATGRVGCSSPWGWSCSSTCRCGCGG